MYDQQLIYYNGICTDGVAVLVKEECSMQICTKLKQ
jgi:hypothetical protein